MPLWSHFPASGLDRLAPAIGQRALVLGAGPIGLLLGRALRVSGLAQIDYLERNPIRQAKAAELGEVFGLLDQAVDGSYDG